MEDSSLIPVLISWRAGGNQVFVCSDYGQKPIKEGFAVVWSTIGKLYFRFLVDNVYRTATQYPTELNNAVLYNYILVESLPDELSQIKYLTLQELEILDEELFGSNTLGHDQTEKVYDCFSEAAEKICSLLKMNVQRNKYRKTVRYLIKIQAFFRGFLSRKRYAFLKSKRKTQTMRKKNPIRMILPFNSTRKTLPKLLPNFNEFRKGLEKIDKKEKFYQLNIRITKRPLV